jgi:hypothetical protein
MNPELSGDLAKTLVAERLEQAERFRRSRVDWARVKPDPFPSVTVRLARPDDAAEVLRLAQLDGRQVPGGPMLVAEADGELLAGRSLISGAAVADPFRPTAHLVELLELRSTHLRDDPAPRRFVPNRARALLRSLAAVARS